MNFDGSVDAFHIAVVGAGPSGLYCADALASQDDASVLVDVIDRLPTPFGLVRYGVAPDHPTIKTALRTLEEILAGETIRFLGHVEVGAGIATADLRACYDAVVYATGAPDDRALAIPGEEWEGCVSAAEVVAWYNGHPDAEPIEVLEATTVAVIGAGNVALDVARILARPVEHLAPTDVPAQVLDVLRRSRVEKVVVVSRRGPEFAKFSTKELRELQRIDDVAVIVHSTELEHLDTAMLEDRRVSGNLAIFRDWADRPVLPGRRQIEFRFGATPAAVVGDRGATSLVLRSTADPTRAENLDVDLIIRSIGFRGRPLPGLPFDEERGVILNEEGRITATAHDEADAAEYVVGWIKRGPSGVIGSNKVDAKETVAALLDDIRSGRVRPGGRGGSFDSLLARRGIAHVLIDGWRSIDRAEIELGASEGRARSKIADWASLRRLGLAEPTPARSTPVVGEKEEARS